ncbi:MAG: tRNA (adenosine(37)-N6)-dimethylallyltransferase MiaA [Clostridia bacterium]|jgi:tRNA dimethylallyltransferase|nr:tRNA (adenosine(37)-N6)-dimethylallyltransferase MiaA [Clostridia bacterium]
MSKPKVIVIGGPTASGKTSLSIELAKKINGEIISSDSMQIYKDMTIGTAKPTVEEMDGIPHHLLDFVSPDERYSVADFKRDAESAIEEILSKKKNPIVVGGTGLYIDSLVYGIEYPDIELDDEYRKKLMQEADTEEGLINLYNKAKKIDPEAIRKISPNDKKRITRILEVYNATGKTKTELEKISRINGVKYDYKVFAINMDREKLYDRINLRVDIMLEQGLIDEVENLVKKYSNFPTAMQGLGYKEVVEFLNKEISKEEMIDKIKQESRRYAKRQLTWFRKNKEIIWLDGLADRQKNIDLIINKAELQNN